MIEMRWHVVAGVDEPGLAFTFADGSSWVLQYRYRLPRHPGFVMQAHPTTGAAVEVSDRWSEWASVEEERLPLPEAA